MICQLTTFVLIIAKTTKQLHFKHKTFQVLEDFLSLSKTIKNVCPNKQIAVGIKLYETINGNKIIKGHKMFAVCHNENCCKDITLSNIHFVLPEEIAETCNTSNICSHRTFDIETTSHYVDLNHI